MADSKVTALTENTTPAATDIIYIVDDPGGTPASQKVTLANIKALVNDITSDAEWDAKGDLVAGTGANTADRLAVGANNTVLMADSTTGTGLKWSGAVIAVDTVWDAAGDLVQGTGANAAARLAIGTAYQTLRVNSGATAAEWGSMGRVLLSSTVTTGSQKTVTINPIAATFNDLELIIVGRSDRSSATGDNLFVYFNNDTTATNYRNAFTGAYAAGTAQDGGADEARIGLLTAASSAANSCGIMRIFVPSYAGTVWNKMMLSQFADRADNSSIHVITHNYGVEWESNVAITRIDVTVNTGNFVDGSIVRLYGLF